MRRLAPRLLLGFAVLLAGCGPVVPLEIAMRQALVDVFYGSPHKAAPPAAPLPVYQPPPPFNFSYPLPPPVYATAAACPALPELAVPKDVASAAIYGPPPVGRYVMRTKGTVAQGIIKIPLPLQLNLIRPDEPAAGTDQVDGAYHDYQLVTGFSANTYTEFDLRLAPDNAATPGILLTALKWHDPVRGNLDFEPQEPMQFLQTPVAINTTGWESAGWDPVAQASVEWTATIPKKDTVNACGVPLDAYQLAISGNIVTPSQVLTWNASYDIGTQFGGLILAEHVQFSDVATGYSYDETSIIDSEPAFPHS